MRKLQLTRVAGIAMPKNKLFKSLVLITLCSVVSIAGVTKFNLIGDEINLIKEDHPLVNAEFEELLAPPPPPPFDLESMASGSYIIDMGQSVPTLDNTLKAYGLLYKLVSLNNVPVKWIINPTKAKDGTDFTYNGVNYKGAPFIVPGEYVNTTIENVILDWVANETGGEMNVVKTNSPISVPVYTTISYYPTWTLDDANGGIAQGYITNAGIPESAYNFKNPQDLDCCDQLFAMPHADPEWETHSNLFFWNQDCNGGLWAACHAVSALENSFNELDVTQQMNFLSEKTGDADPGFYPWGENSLVLWGGPF